MSDPASKAAACRRDGLAASNILAATAGPPRALRIGWVLGWAVPETWFAPLADAALPNAAHAYFPAAPDTLERISATGAFDWLVGYSLGAQLLLSAAVCAPETLRSPVITGPRVALLAPIFAFPSEENLGGRVARAQVRYLARWLRRDRAAALADFYTRAGLDVPPAPSADLPSDTLAWGLAKLESTVLPPALPTGWRTWCGSDDPLLDATCLRTLVPEISVVPEATHHPAALLRAFAREATT
jgi:hypothetical protein